MKHIFYLVFVFTSLITSGQFIDTTLTHINDTVAETGITSIHHENNHNITLSWGLGSNNDSLLYVSTIDNLGSRVWQSTLIDSAAMPSAVIYKNSPDSFVVFSSVSKGIQVHRVTPDSHYATYTFDVNGSYLLKDFKRVQSQTFVLATDINAQQMALLKFNSGDSLVSVLDIIPENHEHNAISIHLNAQTDADGFHIIGNTADRIAMLHTDLEGNIDWIRYYSNENLLQANASVRFKDDYIVAGYSEGFGQGNTNVFLLQLDALGNTVWSKSIGDDNEVSRANDLILDNDKALIMAGTKTIASNTYESFLLKTDTLGNQTGYWPVDNDTEDNGLLSIEPSDSEVYLTLGYKNDNNNRGMLLSYFGYSSATAIPQAFARDIRVYPNPAREYIRISGIDYITKAEIYSVTGKLVDTRNFQHTNQYELPVGNLTSGLYIIVIHDREQTYKSKFIKH